MTRLYVLDRIGDPLPASLARRLPAWRQERLARLKNEKARQESLCAGLLYAYVMCCEGFDPDAPVTILPAGKPVRPDVFFSLSHSGRYVLCAASARSVGVDVQQMRPVNPTIARRFHPDEQAWLAAQTGAERNAALFRLWTRKEAWVKAVSADRFLELSEEDVLQGRPGLAFRDYTLDGGYAAALCGEDAALPEEIRFVSMKNLSGAEE